MINIELSIEEKEQLRYWRFHHPHLHIQEKMEVLYLMTMPSLRTRGLQYPRMCSGSS